MPHLVSLLRGINLGGNHLIRMGELRALYESLGLRDVETHINSGNVVFSTTKRNLDKLASEIKNAVHEKYGFAPCVMFRTREELEQIVAHNPFGGRDDVHPSKLLVTFFDREPAVGTAAEVNAMRFATPEEFRVIGRELFTYYPEGAGRSKFPAEALCKTLKVIGTARNWNTVRKLLAMTTMRK